MKLVRWATDFGRMGSLGGMFVLNDADYALLVLVCDEGQSVQLGEVLGKHSDVEYEFDSDDFEVLTDDASFLLRAAELGVDLSSGLNPLQDWKEQDAERRYDESFFDVDSED